MVNEAQLVRNFTDSRITNGVEMVRLLAVSGSLRQASSNSILLRAVEHLCPEGVQVAHYEGIAELPHFNPDLLEDPPSQSWRCAQLSGRRMGCWFRAPSTLEVFPAHSRTCSIGW